LEATLHAIKQIRDYIQTHPASENGRALAQLVRALAEDRQIPVPDLYRLTYEEFELAIELLKDWRLDRYYAAEIKLFDDVVIKAAAKAVSYPAHPAATQLSTTSCA
jgi:hypothetical protein